MYSSVQLVDSGSECVNSLHYPQPGSFGTHAAWYSLVMTWNVGCSLCVSVKKRTQLKSKLMGQTAWTKRSKESGQFMDVKKSKKEFKGVRREKK